MKRISITLIAFIISGNVYAADEITELKDYITRHYNASPEHCGARMSLSPRERTAGSSASDFACLISGSRKIIWTPLDETPLDSVKRELEYLQYAFEHVAHTEDIKLFEGISFRPEGEQDALLFILFSLQHPEYENDYINGLLLGYSLADIEFFYQFDFYYSHRPDQFDSYSHQPDLPPTYPEFSDEQKKLFDTLTKKAWIGSAEHKKFEQNKAAAEAWLQKYRPYTTKQLYQEIANLEK